MEPTTTETDRVRPIAEWLLIAGFLVALWLPIVDGVLGLDPTPSGVENTAAPQFPKLGAPADLAAPRGLKSRLGRTARELRDFVSNGFGFRLALMRLHNAAQYRLLGRSASPSVVLGKEGWLFYTNDKNLDDYRTAERLSPRDLKTWGRVLIERRDWLGARGIRYLFVLAPNPHTIYPEFLPENLVKIREETRLDQIAGYLTRETDLDILDLRPALRAAKLGGRLYHRTDTHWNQRGAFVAYREIARRLQSWFPSLRPIEESDVVETTEIGPGGDLAGMLALRDVYREEEFRVVPNRPLRARGPKGEPLPYETIVVKIRPLVESEIADPSLPKAVVIRDSYCSPLVPLLSEHFRRAVYVWQMFDPALIEHEKPDVVIEESVERLATSGLPANPPGMTGKQSP